LEKLRSLLSELKAEIAASDAIDEKTQSLMRELEAEIEVALEQENPGHFEQHSIMERLQDSATDFQAEHPALSQFVRRMIDGLGQMGI
jgi:hypothetical protein